jgi:hypothetical protein
LASTIEAFERGAVQYHQGGTTGPKEGKGCVEIRERRIEREGGGEREKEESENEERGKEEREKRMRERRRRGRGD